MVSALSSRMSHAPASLPQKCFVLSWSVECRYGQPDPTNIKGGQRDSHPYIKAKDYCWRKPHTIACLQNIATPATPTKTNKVRSANYSSWLNV
jgi:hypothetical protein